MGDLKPVTRVDMDVDEIDIWREDFKHGRDRLERITLSIYIISCIYYIFIFSVTEADASTTINAQIKTREV